MRSVLLVPIGAVDSAILDYLALILAEVLDVPARVETLRVAVDPAFDPRRQQYLATRLVEALHDFQSAEGEKILGIAEVDLMIPILTFVFGEAELSGRAAVLSLARLKQEFYGLPEDPILLYHRAEKEVLHELGHTAGLIHCNDPECVMRFSSSVEEVDLKGDRFCPRCAAALGKRRR